MMKEDLLPAKARLLSELALIQVEIDKNGLEKVVEIAEEDIVKVEEIDIPEDVKIVEEVKIAKKRGRPSKKK